MKKIIFLLAFALCFFTSKAQSFAINADGSAANGSAMLDVKSTTKGMLIPRMSKAQRNAIPAPANGLLVYVNSPDTVGLCFYNGTTWKWTEEKGSGWGLTGNAGTNPSTHFIGTTDTASLAFRVYNFERMRLTSYAALGIAVTDPKYTLDIVTDASGFRTCNNLGLNGIRVRTAANAINDCEQGFVFGHAYSPNIVNNDENNLYIWNYGQVSGPGPSKNIVFGFNQRQPGFNNEALRITDNRNVGIDEPDPKYNLDIFTGGTTFFPCNDRLGLRINTPWTNGRDCNRGLFLGYNIDGSGTSKKVSLWNFSDNAISAGQYFRFGFGSDFSDLSFGSFGESMRILPPGQGIGIGTRLPRAMLHIENATVSGVPAGVMVTNPNYFGNQNGFFMGLGGPFITAGDEATVWNYQNADVTFGTNNLARMTIKANGNLFFGSEFTPEVTNRADFKVDTIIMRKYLQAGGDARIAGQARIGDSTVIGSTFFPPAAMLQVMGKTRTDELQVVNGAFSGRVLTSDAAGNASWQNIPAQPNYWSLFGNDIYNNNIGNVGIGTSTPIAPLSFASAIGDKISLWGNNPSAHYGLGIQGFLLQIHSAASTDDIAFGYGSSNAFTERVRIKGSGRMIVSSGGSNASSAGIWFNNNANNTLTGFVGMESDAAIGFYGTGTPNGWGLVMNIATGNVGIGTSSPTQKLHVIGNILATGTITPSDIRYKKNIQNIISPLAKIKQLHGVTYQFNQTAYPEWKFDGNLQYGLIAQEVETVFPEMVKTIDEKGYKGVDYVKLVPVLLEAIKEQQKQIDELKKVNAEILEKIQK